MDGVRSKATEPLRWLDLAYWLVGLAKLDVYAVDSHHWKKPLEATTEIDVNQWLDHSAYSTRTDEELEWKTLNGSIEQISVFLLRLRSN